MSKELEHGFYWAKSPALGWIVVELFPPNSWYVPGDPNHWLKSEFIEIDERPIVREETKPKFENLDLP